MESFFNSAIKKNIETDNILYNIINSDNPQYFFLYCIFIIGFLFISTKINYNINILIGLIFSSILIYYFYTYKSVNVLSENDLLIKKINDLNTPTQILNKYPKIIDFLYYMENFKNYSLLKFNNLISTFQNFCQIYEASLINYNQIFWNYQTLIDLKIKILFIINSFIFDTYSSSYEEIIFKQKKVAELILNDLLNNLILIYKKYIYYKGYDTNKKIISSNNILPYNINFDLNYKEHSNIYNISNLLFF